MSIIKNSLIVAGLATTLLGCASVEPVLYTGLSSSNQLERNSQGDTGHIRYSYSPPVNWRKYNRLIIDSVAIYQGPDQQFGDMAAEDKAALAAYMQSQFAEKMKTRFTLTSRPDINTLRLKLTITGVKTNTPVLSTLSRFEVAGGIYNGVQAVRGREGLLTGSVIYAVEIYDATNNRLLRAFVAKQYPSPMNIMASVGSLAASEVGIEKGADELAAQLQ